MAARDIEAGRAHVLLSIRNRLSQGLKLAEKQFRQFGRSVTTSASVITGGAIGSLLWPVKLASDAEQAAVSFEVLVGSAEGAKKLMTDLQTLGAETPFEFGDLRDQAQVLLSFGAKANQVVPMLRMLGDVSGGNAEKLQRLTLAFGQVMAKGRLMGQEVMQMTENGFNPLRQMALDAAAKMGLSGDAMERMADKLLPGLVKQMEAGQIGFGDLVKAFQSATGPGGRFHNMMARISKTFGGLLSTLIDYGKLVATAIGETLLPTLSAAVSVITPVAKALLTVIKANAGLVGGIAKTILVVGLIAGAFAGLGVAALAASYIAGLFGAAIAGISTVLGLVFSPVGLLVAARAGLVGVAIYFRGAIAEAFQGLMIWIQPVVEAFGRIYEVASMAIGGVVDALSNGQMEAAATIAMAGLKAVFWTAVAEIPGTGKLAATGFGQAILAGRWDLAASIGMERIKLVVLQAWNRIANIWSAAVTGLGVIWDMMVYGVRTGWNAASTGIAHAIVWAIGVIKTDIAILATAFDALVTGAQIAANSIKGFFSGTSDQAAAQNAKLRAELAARTSQRFAKVSSDQKAMHASVTQQGQQAQKGINQDLENSMIGRVQSEQAARAARAQSEAAQQQKVRGLEAEASKAAEDAGVKSFEDKAFKAQMDLAKATDAARAAREKGAKLPDNYVPGVAGGSGALPKVESRGTFSAAAAAAFGARSSAPEETARNTRMIAKFTRITAEKKDPAFT
ncbi:MAG: tape measure protein [Aureliella sp.]